MAWFQQRGSKICAVIRLSGYPTERKMFVTIKEAREWAATREVALGGKKSKGGRKPHNDFSSCMPVPAIISPSTSPGPNPLPPAPMTLGDAIRRFQEEVTERRSRPGPERSRLRYWLNDPLAFKPLDAITAVDLTAWRQKAEVAQTRFGRVVSPQTIIHRLNLLSCIYSHARYEWAIPRLENPVKDVRKPPQPPARFVKFSPEQREIFWKFVKSKRRGVWVYI
ncbi:hypothetical protein [Azospirillum doebereinerae]